MFTYANLSFALLGALLLFFILNRKIGQLRHSIGHTRTYTLVWILVGVHWLVAMGLVVTGMGGHIPPRLADGYMLGLILVVMTLAFGYRSIAAKLEHKKMIEEFGENMRHHTDTFRARVRRDFRRFVSQ